VSTLDELTVPKIEQTGPVATDEFVYIDISSVDNKTKRIVDPKRLPVTFRFVGCLPTSAVLREFTQA